MLETIGELVGGVATGGIGPLLGGITGLVGVGVTKYFAHKEAKLASAEKALDRKHDLDVMQFEAKTAADMQTAEQNAIVERADIDLRKVSMQSDAPLLKFADGLSNAQRWLVVLADVFCRFVRPTSTIYFQLLTTGLGVWCAMLLNDIGASLSDGINPMSLMIRIVDMILYLTCTSTTWWFGVRGMSKK